MKFDKAGMGYNEKVSQETKNPWWVRVYNEAASKEENSSAKKSKNKSPNEAIQMNFNNLTDEELFAACGGRTAHKAARHGLKLNGKLERIKKQEILASPECPAAVENEEVPVIDTTSSKKSKRRKADSNKVEEVTEQSALQSEDVETSSENYVLRKKRKKKAKEENHADNTREPSPCQQIVSKKKSKKKSTIES